MFTQHCLESWNTVARVKCKDSCVLVIGRAAMAVDKLTEKAIKKCLNDMNTMEYPGELLDMISFLLLCKISLGLWFSN